MLPNISQSKGNQTIKFDRMIENNKRSIFFLKNHRENETGRLVPDLKGFYLQKIVSDISVPLILLTLAENSPRFSKKNI